MIIFSVLKKKMLNLKGVSYLAEGHAKYELNPDLKTLTL